MILSAMCRIFLAVGLGFYAYKRGILNPEVNEKLSELIVRILAPFVILNSVSSVPHEQPVMVWRLFVCGIVMYLTVPFFAWAVTRLLRIPVHLRGTFMCMLTFSNASFMGFPIVEALYGSSAIFYMTIFNMPFNFLFYTLAFYLVQKDAKAVEHWDLRGILKTCVNPGMLASVAALLIYFLQIRLPEIFCTSAQFVGNIMTPMAMMVVGASLAASSFKEIRTEKIALLMLPVRLLVLPILVWFVVGQVTADTTMTEIATLTAAMPVGTMVSLMSVPYPRQNKLAAIGVAVSTLCSLVTIPLLVAVLGIK